jgi:hypothetical protein
VRVWDLAAYPPFESGSDFGLRELIAELTTKNTKSAKRSKTACFYAFFAFFAVAQEFCNWLSDFGFTPSVVLLYNAPTRS